MTTARRQSRRRTWWLLAAFALVAVLFCWPLYSHLDYWGIQDWDAFLTRNSVSRLSVVQYGQFPLWNPYSMGGVPQLAHPETNVLSLPFFIDLLCGVLVGVRVSIVLHLFLGLAGMYALARQFRLGVTASVLAAMLFMLNSMYGLFLATGTSSIGLAIAYMPWAMLFFVKAWARFSWALACGAVLTMMWLQGGTYNFFLILLMMGIHGLVLVITREQGLLTTARLLATVALAPLLLGAVRFFPSLEFTLRYPRKIVIYSGFSVESLLYGLLGRDQTIAAIVGKSVAPGMWRGFTHAMDEVGMYIGVVPLLLCLFGIVWRFLPERWLSSATPAGSQPPPCSVIGPRHYAALLSCLLISLWLGFGNRCEPLSLWALINQVPPFSFMRTSERFRFTIMLFVALFAAIGLQAGMELLTRKFARPRLSQRLAMALVIGILLDLFRVNSPALEDAFSIPPLPTPHSDSFVQLGGFPEYGRQGIEPSGEPYHLYRTYGAMYPAFLSNAGSVYALESVPAPTRATILTDPAYRGEVYLEGTPGTARYTLWSPNRLAIAVAAAGEGYVVVNQNYYPGWHAADGLRVEERNGLLAVKVSPRINSVELYYRPTSFIVGALTSVLSLLGGGLWFRRLRLREEALDDQP